MRRSLIAVTLLAPLVLVAAKDSKDVPEATPSGKPVSCIQLTSIRESRVRSDQVIDFVMRDNTVYRNTLPYACPGLGFEERYSYETSLSQLCSTDVITVLMTSPPMRGATCGLGQFQPVTLAKPAKK